MGGFVQSPEETGVVVGGGSRGGGMHLGMCKWVSVCVCVHDGQCIALDILDTDS